MNFFSTKSTLLLGNKYEFEESQKSKLGSGAYANVYKGVDKSNGSAVAIKVIELAGRNARELTYLQQEVEIMRKLRHPNVIQLYHIEKSKDGRRLFLVVEFCGGGDLKSFLAEQRGRVLDEDTSRDFMIQFASGLKHLHDNGVVHRDLKPQNILLSERSKQASLKIGDLGFARVVNQNQIMTSFVGSPLYMAPEVLLSAPYNSNADLWSVGVIFYEMLTGTTPITAKVIDELKLKSRMLIKDNKRRLGWDEFFAHEYLQPKNLAMSTMVKPKEPAKEPHKLPSTPSKPPVASPVVATPTKGNPAATPAPVTPSKPAAEVKVPSSPVSNAASSGDQHGQGFSWLQKIYVFGAHGHTVTLYLKPNNTVAKLKATLANLMAIVSPSDLVFITGKGVEMKDEAQVSVYNLAADNVPIHVFPFPLFMGKSIPAPEYSFERLPPEEMEDEVPPLPSSPLEDVRVIEDASYVVVRGEYLQRRATILLDKIYWKQNQVAIALTAHAIQESSYLVLTTNYAISQSLVIKDRVRQYTEVVKLIEGRFKEFLTKKETLLEELKFPFDPRMDPAIKSDKPINTLSDYLSAFNGSNFTQDYNTLVADYDELKRCTQDSTRNADKVTKVIDSLSGKLDPEPVNQMKTLNGMLKGIYTKAQSLFEMFEIKVNKSKADLTDLVNAYHSARNASTEMPKGLKESFAAFAKSNRLSELESIFNEITITEQKCNTQLEECRQHKNLACKNMFESLAAIMSSATEFATLLAQLSKMPALMQRVVGLVDRCSNAVDLKAHYLSLYNESVRRSKYRTRVNKMAEKFNATASQLWGAEVKDRQLQRSLIKGHKAPLAPFIFDDTPEKLPIIAVKIEPIDPSLPSFPSLKNDTEDDDFGIIVDSESDNLSEKVKELEVTNAQLKQQLVETVKQLKQPEPRPDLEMLMRLESENIKLKESLQIQRSEAEKAKELSVELSQVMSLVRTKDTELQRLHAEFEAYKRIMNVPLLPEEVENMKIFAQVRDFGISEVDFRALVAELKLKNVAVSVDSVVNAFFDKTNTGV